jgi:indolepyruvate ferredoxin oxidoreductase alpha subunit
VNLPPTGPAPLLIAESRCNRCRACLALGCPSISYLGGEAMEIDGASCTGCGLCAPLCRARAIGPALRLAG